MMLIAAGFLFKEVDLIKKDIGILTTVFLPVAALAFWAETANVSGD